MTDVDFGLLLAFWLGGVAFFLTRIAIRIALFGIPPASVSVRDAVLVILWPLAALASPLLCLAPRRLVDAAIGHARQAGVRGVGVADPRPGSLDCIVVSVMPSPDDDDVFFVGSTAHKAGALPISTTLERVKADQLMSTATRILFEGLNTITE